MVYVYNATENILLKMYNLIVYYAVPNSISYVYCSVFSMRKKPAFSLVYNILSQEFALTADSWKFSMREAHETAYQ
jgi:hypothetical protein